MEIVLLTTETTHHTYYASRLAEAVPLRAIVVETVAPTPPFETAHPFERARDEYERDVLLDGLAGSFADVAETREVGSANDADALTGLAPDVLLVFGTGRLLPHVPASASLAALNLHGGNPEHYRGLDTHLWAIYHRDFANLVTTLHVVDDELDTGDIVLQAGLELARGMGLHELRAVNTRTCVELSLLALRALESTGRVPRRRQVQRGRYYSFMPAALKERCVDAFDRHVATL